MGYIRFGDIGDNFMNNAKIVLGVLLIFCGFFIIAYCIGQKEKLKQCDTAVVAKVINLNAIQSNFKALKSASAKISKTPQVDVPVYMAVLEYQYKDHTYTTKPTEINTEIKMGSEVQILIDQNDPEHFKINDNDILTTMSYGLFSVVGGLVILVISIIRLF